jgi:hypothetical protein
MHEARIDDTPAGRLPADGGWWVLNLGEIAWESAEGNGTFCVFEAPAARSPVLGIGVFRKTGKKSTLHLLVGKS